MSPERALLAGAIDYAGLFPPADLTLAQAAANYKRYKSSDQAWALGRFVAPVGRVAELELPDEWLAVVGTRDAEADAMALRGRTIEVIEAVTSDAAAVRARLAAHPGVTCYCEMDPAGESFGAASEAVKRGGARAKIRTGGVTAEVIPPGEKVLAFLQRCHELGLAGKATAGLHHAVRGEYPLTYAPGAPRAVMHGYLNLLLAATCLSQGGSIQDAGDILDCGDGRRLWPARWSAAQIVEGRKLVVGFGSCSFEEPLRWLSPR